MSEKTDAKTIAEERFDLYVPPKDGTPYLIVLASPANHSVGSMFSLSRPSMLVGRGARSDITIDDARVSRHHARVEIRGGLRVLVDLDSTNGTFVNGARVRERALKEGDKVQFGPDTILKYTVQDLLEETTHRELYDSAVKDALTGLYNRRYFNHRFEIEHAHSTRHARPLAVLLLDLDEFKQVNDTWGHQTGDRVLKAVAAILTRTVRRGDVVARIGGEEFALLLRECGAVAARVLAERIRSEVEALRLPSASASIQTTLSVGLAVFDGQQPADPQALLRSADERLYEAKRDGRNQIAG